MPKIEKLFAAVNKTEHVYTWDHSKEESACELFDVDDHYFALITRCHDVDEETGAMGDYRESNYKRCHLYSKQSLQVTETFEFKKDEETIQALAHKPWGSTVSKIEVINLKSGKVYLMGGDLILEWELNGDSPVLNKISLNL